MNVSVARPEPSTSTAMDQPPVYKLVNRSWKTLPDKGEDVFIRDPKLKEGHIGDLSKKSIAQLQEIMERQDRILNNKFLSSKLKDKGVKLKERREMIAEALRKALEQNINYSRKDTPADINALEWKSRRKNENKKEELDSDDDEDECEDKLDPLKLMAYHSSCVKKPALTQNGTREEEDPTNAIAQELMQLDLQDAEQQPHVSFEFGDKRNQMLEEMRIRNGPVKDSFKPFRPVTNPQPIPGLVHHTAWSSSGTTKTIPQQEALKLEREFLIKEKERTLSYTRGQLEKIKTGKIGLPPPSLSLNYRDTNINKHLLDSENESDDSESLDFYTNEL